MTHPGRPKRVLFVYHENCNRSQMAEAFARIHEKGRMLCSGGMRPKLCIMQRLVLKSVASQSVKQRCQLRVGEFVRQ